MNAPRHWLAALIQRYKQAGGGRRFFAVECNFTPTCSEYTRQAVLDQGVYRGLRIGWQRIKRCTNPDSTEKLSDPYQGETDGSISRA